MAHIRIAGFKNCKLILMLAVLTLKPGDTTVATGGQQVEIEDTFPGML